MVDKSEEITRLRSALERIAGGTGPPADYAIAALQEQSTEIVHARTSHWSDSLCGNGRILHQGEWKWRDGHRAVDFIDDRYLVNCAECRTKVNSRLDGTPITHLDLSVRTYNALIYERITTIEYAHRIPDHYLLRIPNFGRKSLKELRQVLAEWQESHDQFSWSAWKSAWINMS